MPVESGSRDTTAVHAISGQLDTWPTRLTTSVTASEEEEEGGSALMAKAGTMQRVGPPRKEEPRKHTRPPCTW